MNLTITDKTFDDIMNEALSRSNARKQGTIRALVKVLEGMRTKGVRVFSIANVGRECEAANILTTQAIRNKTGADFREIINAFAGSIGAPTTHVAPVKQTPLEEAISLIADLDVRTRIRSLMAENKAQRAEISRLTEAFKRLRQVPVAALPKSDVDASQCVEILPPVESVDVAPLEKFVSDQWLNDLLWHVGDDGAIYEKHDRLTPVGFVPTLKRVIKAAKKG